MYNTSTGLHCTTHVRVQCTPIDDTCLQCACTGDYRVQTGLQCVKFLGLQYTPGVQYSQDYSVQIYSRITVPTHFKSAVHTRLTV